MFEITHFLCHNGAEGSIEWSYQAGGGSINMGDFLVSCQLANDIASAYGLGIPEKTAIQFSQGEEESPIAKNFDVTKFNITDNKIPRWIGFVQKFKPIR
jgi:serine/threonine-protein kinase